jgi:hypothetical protein
MNSNISALWAKMRELQDELDNEMVRRREELRYSLHEKKVIFDQLVERQHLKYRAGLIGYVFNSRILVVLISPVIYSMIIPLVCVDLFFSVYQHLCFPIYKINTVNRSDYLIFDRKQLSYLNLIEKLNCIYCSYGNGVLAYAVEIAARTEQYWCPIKHARKLQHAHARYHRFVDYGDAEAYVNHLEKLRSQLRSEESNH